MRKPIPMQVFATIASTILLLSGFEPALAQSSARYEPIVLDLLNQGSKLLNQGKLVESRTVFLKALEIQPECPEAYNNVGLSYYRGGDLENAAHNYQRAMELDPLFVPSITNLGVVRYKQKRLAEAIKLYRLAIRLTDDKDAELQYNLANALRDDKKYEEAKRRYQRAIDLNPQFWAAHNGLGATHYCLKEFDAAEKEVRRAISLKPNYAHAYFHLGLIQAATDRIKDALVSYENSLKFESNPAYAEDTKRKIAALKGRLDPPVIAANVTAVKTARNPKKDKAIEYLRSDSFVKAEETLKALLSEGHGGEASLWHDYGYSLSSQSEPGKVDTAIAAYKKSLELSTKKAPQTYYNLAQVYMSKRDFAQAEKNCLEAIRTAQATHEVCPLAYNLQAILLKRRGDLKKADEAYCMAIAQAMGKYPVIHYNRAALLEKMNRANDALAEYNTYLKKAPTGLNADKAKKRVHELSGSSR